MSEQEESLGFRGWHSRGYLRISTHRAFWVEAAAGQRARGLPDSDDAPFLDCARTANVPLVTGNLRHFPKSVTGKVPVLTPARFVAALER